MPFSFHVPLPGPFSYSARLGGKRRAPRRGPSAAEVVAERIERHGQAFGQRLLDHQAEAAERHEAERPVLVGYAREVAAQVDRAQAREIEARIASLAEVPGGTVQYLSRAKKLRRLLDDVAA